MASWVLLGGRWIPQITPDPGQPIIFGTSGIWDFRLPVLGNEIPPLVLGGAGGRGRLRTVLDARDRAGVV